LKMRYIKISACTVLFLVFYLCGALSYAFGRINVVVSIFPMAEFVEKVAGDKAGVTVMVPSGADPHTYEPIPSQLKKLNNADMYVMTGSGIEFELTWMDKFKSLNRSMLICDSSAGIVYDEDPHVWLSPVNAMRMVENIKNVFVEFDPLNADLYNNNARAYIKELAVLDKEIKDIFSMTDKKEFIVFHAAWRYFASDYGLKEIPMVYGEKEPTVKELAAIIKKARELSIKTIFASPQFNRKSAEVISKEIGGKVINIDPLAKDYIENIRGAADKIAESIR
jgi:zinc transport system substrate-binding protein